LHRHLTLLVLFVVLGAGVVHAAWNAIGKSVQEDTDRVVTLGWLGTASITAGVIGLPLAGLPGEESAFLAVASAILHTVYFIGLMRSYRLGAFNQMYPVARGTSPLLVTLGAAIFASEHPGGIELAGIAVLAGGLVSFALSGGRLVRSETPALGAALLTGVMIATYTIVDGIGVRHASDPFSYMALSFLLEGISFVTIMLAWRRPHDWLRPRAAGWGFTAGALAAIGYGAVMWAQTKAPLAEVAALRETGVISGALIGALFFKEGFGGRRVASAAVVALGIALIAL
jgi:uncharacterized membrane protein